MAHRRSTRSQLCRIHRGMGDDPAEATDAELDSMAEMIADWIKSIDPDFFVPEDVEEPGSAS